MGKLALTVAIIVSALAAVLLAIEVQEETLICETDVYGIRLELHRSPLLGRETAVVFMEPGSDLLPGVPARYEIQTNEQAEMLAIALAGSGAQTPIFSSEFRDRHCRPR